MSSRMLYFILGVAVGLVLISKVLPEIWGNYWWFVDLLLGIVLFAKNTSLIEWLLSSDSAPNSLGKYLGAFISGVFVYILPILFCLSVLSLKGYED
jgi:hypothetical protein